MSFLNDLLALSHVPRWSIVRHSPGQSVADHSFRVAVIAMRLVQATKTPIEADGIGELIWACLTHDVDESFTGDIPTPAKRNMSLKPDHIKGITRYLTMDELRVLQLADRIEAYTFISMNGKGSHAQQVEDLARQHLVGESDIIHRVIDEILFEMGRLQVTWPTRDKTGDGSAGDVPKV